MDPLKGIAASPGLVTGPAYVFVKDEVRATVRNVLDVAAQGDRLDAALRKASQEISAIRDRTAVQIGENEARVFDAHLLFLSDPTLVDTARDRIKEDKVAAEWAFQETGEGLAQMLETLDDATLKERAADVRDVVQRVVRILMNRPAPSLAGLTVPSIVVAKDLTPSETAQMPRDLILGFATDVGGRTSHTAIMAQAIGIPAVVGLGNATAHTTHGVLVALDGNEGMLFVQPDGAQMADIRVKLAAHEVRMAELSQQVGLAAITRDGVKVELAANIGKPSEAADAVAYGAEGIGLFRTEFLYMNRGTLPTEEEQYQAYKKTLETMGPDRAVIIRTLDIGGDKQMDALELPTEANPFLGLRAIRLCFERRDLFKIQLRALLRASLYGRMRIMYPMIQSVAEVQLANAVLAECRAELEAEGVPVGKPEVGIMVEIPAAAAIADLLAEHVDFFSIGTNDLIQYTLAVDRMNERVSHLYQAFHPAILRLIHQTCMASHQAGKWTGMCGEMAGDPVAAAVLLGLGLDEWSMSAPALNAVKEILRGVTKPEATVLAKKLMHTADPAQARLMAEEFYRAHLGGLKATNGEG